MTPNFRDFLIIFGGAILFGSIVLSCTGCTEMTEQERWEWEERRVAEIIACKREPQCFLLCDRGLGKKDDVRDCRPSMGVLVQ